MYLFYQRYWVWSEAMYSNLTGILNSVGTWEHAPFLKGV